MGISPINTGILYSKGVQNFATESESVVSEQQSVFFRSMDSAVVKFGDKVPFPTPIHGSADLSDGVHFLLFDNYWYKICHACILNPICL
eukprot:SAG31_NODE_2838_length_5017_cov_3.102074_7_plen_89_part_00